MRFLLILCLNLYLLPSALAWNGAGHRLSALIAWQQMSPATRAFVSDALRQHPDHPQWLEKSGTGEAEMVFAEATTWADSIRRDPRFHDERREAPATPLADLPDTARHGDWHYVNFDRKGRRGSGEIDRQIDKLSGLLRSTADRAEIAWALPWLAHLVADIHQPLHTGYGEDIGGNDVLVENPAGGNKVFGKLHAWWDELPGPSSLRGKRLQRKARTLVDQHPAPRQGEVADWLAESHALLADAYPVSRGSVSLLIDSEFARRAQATADRQIVAAGYRLGRLLESIRQSRVPRETGINKP